MKAAVLGLGVAGPVCFLDQRARRGPGWFCVAHLDCGRHYCSEPSRHETVWPLWLAAFGALAALFCNPWKAGLLRWLIGSVLWMRPEIQEWNPTPLGWDHAAFFILVALAAFAWSFTRRSRAWWEFAACAAFALLGCRSVRHAPLCAIVILSLAPPHLADALARFRAAFAGLEEAALKPVNQKLAAILCCLGATGSRPCDLHPAQGTSPDHGSAPLAISRRRDGFSAQVRFARTRARLFRLGRNDDF